MVSYDLLMNYALKLLGQRKHTQFEVRQKMKKKFQPTSELLNEVVNRLKDLKYLNDEDFAISWINYRSERSSRGLFRLQQELKQKGISRNLIEKALGESEFDECQACEKAVRSKLKLLKPGLPKDKKQQKIVFFLQSRGFSYEVIRETLAKVG